MQTKSYTQAGTVSVAVGAVSRRRSGEPSKLRSVRALLSRGVHRSQAQMVVRRSWLHIRQSLCSLHPYRRLPLLLSSLPIPPPRTISASHPPPSFPPPTPT